MEDRRDQLAEEIRDALGQQNDQTLPVVHCVQNLVEQVATLTAENAAMVRQMEAESLVCASRGDEIYALTEQVKQLKAQLAAAEPVMWQYRFGRGAPGVADVASCDRLCDWLHCSREEAETKNGRREYGEGYEIIFESRALYTAPPQHAAVDWRAHSAQFARGESPPHNLETAQAAWARDQELIFDQRDTIAKQSQTINKLRQSAEQHAARVPELGSHKMNEAAWAFTEALPLGSLRREVFASLHLKSALHAAFSVLAAPTPPAQEGE